MDNLWPWFLVVVALIVVVLLALPVLRRSAPKKLEILKTEQEEFAEEITPTVLPKRTGADEDIFIPHNYGVDRLVLSVKDPNWLHAYWEISATKHEEFISQHGTEAWHSSRPVIRVYDISDLKEEVTILYHSFKEVYIDPWADNWFIEVGQPDRTFFVELGRLLVDGNFISLLRSNLVTTPRASVSNRFDEEWMWIGELYQSIGRISYGLSSEVLVEKHIVEGIPLGISSPGFENK